MIPVVKSFVWLLCIFGTLFQVGCAARPSAHSFRIQQSAINHVNSDHVGRILASRRCESPMGYVWPDQTGVRPAVGYVPQEGDIVLMTCQSPFFTSAYSLGRAGHPLHAGLIVRRFDDSLAILEAGGLKNKSVSILPVEDRFHEYLGDNINALIWVRPIKAPPHPDQSAMLTQFAESQNGKKFGLFRLAVYVLPVRPKMSASADQSSWYCSELSVAALRHAGMIADGSDTTSVLPHEIYHNRSVDLSERFWPSLAWSPERQFPQHRPVLSPLRPE